MPTLAEVELVQLRYLEELERRAAKIRVGVGAYYNDPVGFAKDCINWPEGSFLTAYQQNILATLGVPRKPGEVVRSRVAVRGPHGLGKTAIAATAVLWFALTRDATGTDWKIATTAGSWHQLIQYLWPEIHRWSGRINWQAVRNGRRFRRDELQNINLKLTHGNAFAAASANAALIEGAHADSLLFIYDESKSIPANTFDAVEGAFSGTGEALALAISTPGEPAGRFYDFCTHRPGYEDWTAIHVTLQQAMEAGRISEEWADQRRKQWGATSALYVNRVLGDFHAGDEDSVIPLSWIEAANERWHEWNDNGKPEQPDPHVVGVDVARTGEDKTCLAIRHGDIITEIRTYSHADTMATTGRVKGVLDADPSCVAMVDVIGIGAGVYDRLREQTPRQVMAFNAAGHTNRRDVSNELSFRNIRAAAWWHLRELLDPSAGATVALPPDEDLTGDLTTPKMLDPLSGGKLQVEPKEKIRERIGRSTDKGDAVVQAFWEGQSFRGMWTLICESCGQRTPNVDGTTKVCRTCGHSFEDPVESEPEPPVTSRPDAGRCIGCGRIGPYFPGTELGSGCCKRF